MYLPLVFPWFLLCLFVYLAYLFNVLSANDTELNNDFFLFLFFKNVLFRTRVLPVCMSAHYACAWYPWKPEEGVWSPGTGVSDREPPRGCWEIEPKSSAGAASALNHRARSPALLRSHFFSFLIWPFSCQVLGRPPLNLTPWSVLSACWLGSCTFLHCFPWEFLWRLQVFFSLESTLS